ncbi:MAG: magnesium-translocating P-type ATPase [Rhodobacteraceae bacterium]|jgi:Mg2+-importing ATPase|uniref:magnesium-translocating P-type ATPase n=1 Tax=Albidovulum sp. TaxID=1872424 RepID=UPI001D4E06EB|nr:magnesium-translocating P-type ATPase [uncultured Defluviimonas sp.]MCB2127056.1 magnesium-translocating P-type ATPase [Paracoccaceae bacterium]MCC0070395.1 magnesium-translocating P-type ATPase [Paracoccaceae bacterium]
MLRSPEVPDGSGRDAYWAVPADALLEALETSTTGLASSEAGARLRRLGPNRLRPAQHASALTAFARQFRSPLVLILIFAAVVSAIVGEGSESVIIALIVLASSVLSFTQEFGASRAMEALGRRIARRVTVVRDATETPVPVDTIVPGDVIRLSAGTLIPADGVLLQARDFDVSEATLTGETFPVTKAPGVSAAAAPIGQRTNAVFAGTSVRSGTATMLAVRTGRQTELAGIAAAIARREPETEFARGIRRFGYLMTEVMLVIVLLVFLANILLDRPTVDALLFALALAVGLTPELLPAIISVTLARGARKLAAGGVIVRRLDAIENLGSMDVLCTDKTGTLTEGVVRLDAATDATGAASAEVGLWALLNARFQTGMANPLDAAIAAEAGAADATALDRFVKVDEIPYDFVRKRLSVVVRAAEEDGDLLICKGAVQNVVAACDTVQDGGARRPLDAAAAEAIDAHLREWSLAGFRTLGVAVRRLPRRAAYGREHEAGLAFAGFLLFLDPPKPGLAETLRALARRGVAVKMITGDNRYVAAHLAATVGLPHRHIVTGADLSHLTQDALAARAPATDIFAEIDPNQKERIIAALRQRGHVVGYLGDGINDAPALHEADVGISVDGAVDVAREAADMILMRRDLDVVVRGVDDGRATFANTMKYIAITTSANFGNMVSMAVASIGLPFLPLAAPQILLNNFLSDLPSLAIATDRVDRDDLSRPHHWDIGHVRRFMVAFGLVSSAFDFLTFAFLLLVAHATEALFQTAWFVESLLTELAIVLIVRTWGPAWKSRPSALLSWLSLAVGALALALPYLPGAGWFGFVPLPLPVMAGLVAITLAYLAASEAAKHLYLARALRHRDGRSRDGRSRAGRRRTPPA